MGGSGPGGALAEIGFDDGRVAGDVARAAACDLPALVKHHHPGRQRHDDFHDVLDNDQGNAGTMDVAHQIDGKLHFALGEACHRFVEQQHLGLGRQRAGDFKPLAARRSQRPRRRVRQPAHADAFQHGERTRFGFGAMRRAQKRADHHILQYRHALERLRHLKGPREAALRAGFRRQMGDVLTFEQDLAGRRQEVAGQAIEEGGFAGAVRPDQAENVALLQRYRGGIDRLEAAKRFGDLAGFKEHAQPPCAAWARGILLLRLAQIRLISINMPPG